jgi:hypothetical protein
MIQAVSVGMIIGANQLSGRSIGCQQGIAGWTKSIDRNQTLFLFNHGTRGKHGKRKRIKPDGPVKKGHFDVYERITNCNTNVDALNTAWNESDII